MKVKQSLKFIISGLFLCLGLLLTVIVAMIRTVISMAHRIR